MITKIEFVDSTEITVASPTVLATYTKIYKPEFSAQENSSPVGYFVQSPRTLSFELDIDSFLLDDVYDSSNDMESGYFTTDKQEVKYKYFCDKFIKVYENDEYTFCGIIITSDMNYSEDEQKIKFKFSDPLLMISNVQNVIPGMPSNISIAFDRLFGTITDQYLGSGAYPDIISVQDYTEKSNIEWTDIKILREDRQSTSVRLHSYGLSEDRDYLETVSVWKNVLSDDYIVNITTFDKMSETASSSSYPPYLYGATAKDGYITSLFGAPFLASMITSGTYTLTKEDGNEYKYARYQDLPTPDWYLKAFFSGRAFVTSLNYTDNTDVKYSEFLDIATIINDLQIQLKIDSSVPKFYITNRDGSTTDIGTIDENDVIELDNERIIIDQADYDKFDILDDDFKEDIIPDIQNYYNEYSAKTNRSISFLLSNITNNYNLGLDNSFTFDSVKWKVSRISKESERVQKVEAWIINGGIEVLYPNGGQELETGNTYSIQYRTISINSTETIKIELWKTGIFDSTISASTTNTGSFEWDTTGIPDSTEYKIRITLLSDTSIYDESDTYFSVIAIP